MKNIRNFCIIAHIDHGKSTLADRILEITGLVRKASMEQMLDNMDLERERGITIKAKSVRIPYQSASGGEYILNLIDTPGHVDFNYEVSRSLNACDGAVLLVDATQGVEAQTIANANLAFDAGLKIIPVINKIDLPGAMVDDCSLQLYSMLGLRIEDILLVSAKDGTGVPELLEAIVDRVPPPTGSADEPLKCLIFDSFYDAYRGVIPHIRVFSGCVKPGDKIMLKSTEKIFEVEDVGYFSLGLAQSSALQAGDVGYIVALIRNAGEIHVGDTVVSADHPEVPAIPGFRMSQSMVYCGIYPIVTSDYAKLGAALEKFKLNDSSVVYEKENSAALGYGYRIGFLGMLHMEIALERLKREYEQDIIATMPSVIYKVFCTNGDILMLDNPSKFPPEGRIDHIEEPIIRARIIVPADYVGPCMELAEARRSALVGIEHPDDRRAILIYDLPLAEMITDFYDRLKSVSRGYASMDYELNGYRAGDLVKVDILVNNGMVDALSYISPRDNAAVKGKALIYKLSKVIPRHLFKIPLQAAIGSQVIARADIYPMRKDVIAKCYGGDITRKRKLLEKQKEGKKKMKMVGFVEVPQEAFLSLMKIEE
ncbi:MAG: translation elongation factor 4 [Dehalococcoidia bacterium]|nr:translation elongation factor 4 [Dehalococcoidia bacterium]MDD5495370.1 translation elongation factor 4 [Dehalococcoidia bacterium]